MNCSILRSLLVVGAAGLCSRGDVVFESLCCERILQDDSVERCGNERVGSFVCVRNVDDDGMCTLRVAWGYRFHHLVRSRTLYVCDGLMY